jgi:hypothetical protein
VNSTIFAFLLKSRKSAVISSLRFLPGTAEAAAWLAPFLPAALALIGVCLNGLHSSRLAS